MEINNGRLRAGRVIEGGKQRLELPLPCLITVANSANKLGHKRFTNVHKMKELMRDKESLSKMVFIVSLPDVGADSNLTGMTGSPTVVGKTWKLGAIGGSCIMFKGDSPEHESELLVNRLIDDQCGIEELLK